MDGAVHAVVVSTAAPSHLRREPPHPSAPRSDLLACVDAPDLVVAADGGLDVAEALGLTVDVVVGDLDSVDTTTLDAARARGVAVESHPREKNETDLELALDAACARGASRITVLDGRAGRLDHFLATALLLAHPRYRAIEVRAVVDDALITVVPAGAERELTGHAGDVVTLLAVGGTARDVHTSGLRYALDGDALEPGSTRGVSNALLGEHAAVWIADGALLAVQPSRGAVR